METLKKLIIAENDYRMKDETIDMFLGAMTELHLKPNEPLIDYGALDSSIYLVRSGIIRSSYFNGFREMTHAFGTEGTMIMSYYTYHMGEPSFFKYEACCNTVVMKITKARFIELMRQSHDFSQWVTSMFSGQLWAYEKKLAVVNGDVKERFDALMKNRPDIIEKVPMKYISAYIGVTPQHLCKMKRRYMKDSEK